MEKFLYVISHDLYEPLRSIKVFGAFLADEYGDKLDERGNEYLKRMMSAAGRMNDMIDGLLKLSRIERDESKSEVNLNEVFLEACAEMGTFIRERNGTVKSGPLPVINANRGEIKELFTNLMENAIKFNSSQNPSVSIKSRGNKDGCTFIFEDNAISIPPKDYMRIFDVFECLHERGRYGGAGVGLAICRKIVEHHGGRIWVEGGKEGNIFFFTLPYR